LDAEQCAEFFHCLVDFPNFTCMGEKIVIHKEFASPALLVEKLPGGGSLLKSSILVHDSPFPLNEINLVAGRGGCWIGVSGEYWWIPA